jgi:hypothetical protein
MALVYAEALSGPWQRKASSGELRSGEPVEMSHQWPTAVSFNWQLAIRVLDRITVNPEGGAL